MHRDLRDELKAMEPSLAREIIQLAAPQPEEAHLVREAAEYEGRADPASNPSARCTVSRFVQYAVCDELGSSWARNWTALSFGGNGYDDWSQGVKRRFGVRAELFDCFDPRPVDGLVMHALCIGGEAQRAAERGKHAFADLNELLAGQEPRSVLMKLDIEGSEYDVLHELQAAAWNKVAYFTVEFHYLAHVGSRCCSLDRVKALLEKLASDFLVIDGAAQRWGRETPSVCRTAGSYKWPSALSVSYVARDLLQP